MEDKIRFNWVDLVLKVLFLVVFFLILLWLYPSNNLTTFYDKVFNDNVQTMKDAARGYYQLDRLPEKEGQSKKMTLAEMENMKILLPFKDKDGKTCDSERSFVEVTKLTNKEYALKVYLSCGNQSDFIIDTIGKEQICIDCGNNNQNNGNNNNGNNNNGGNGNNIDNGNNDKDNSDDEHDKPPLDDNTSCSLTEYEFKRTSTKKEYEKCPEGYVQGTSYCTKSELASVTAAKLVTKPSRKVVTNASVNKGDSYKVYADPIINNKYVCSSEFDNAGTYTVPTECVKTGSETAPAERKDTYTCSNEFTNAGTYTVYTKCYGKSNTYKQADLKTQYVCSSSYDNAGTYNAPTTCKRTLTETAPAAAKTTYTCSSAYDNAGTYNSATVCYKVNRVTEPAKLASSTTLYTCSSVYDNAGTYSAPTTCKKTVTDNKPSVPSTTSTTKYECSSYYDNAGIYSSPTTCRKTVTDTRLSIGTTTPGYYTSWSCGTCSAQRFPKTQADTSTRKYSYQGTAFENYCVNSNCPGYITVYYYVVYTRGYVSPKTTHSCPSGYSPSGVYNSPVNCTKTTVQTAGSTPNTTTKTTYSCPSGYLPSGVYNSPVNCTKTTVQTAQAVPSTKKVYNCDSSFANAGNYSVPTTCYKDVKTTAVAPSNTKYTCSSEFTNAGTYSVPTTCKKIITTSAAAPRKDTYTCSSEYQNAGTYNIPTLCVKDSAYVREPQLKTDYVCNNTFDNKGIYQNPTTCTRKSTIKTPSTSVTNGSCPQGYNQTGTGNSILCYKTVKNTDTYYCSDANAKLVGNKCEKTVKGSSKYTCDAGSILSQGKCYKYNNSLIERKEESCKETTEYIWSPTETLEGWTRTGNTRKTNVRCPEVTDCTKEENKITCDDVYEAK